MDSLIPFRGETLFLSVVVALILFATNPTVAQVELDDLLVTATSTSAAARWEDGSSLEQSDRLFDSPFDVLDNQELMIFSASGQVVLQVIGPAKLAVRKLDDEGRIDVELYFGVLIATTPTPQAMQVVEIVSPGETGTPLFRGPVGRGWSVYSRFAERQIADIAYVGEAGAVLGFQIDVLGQRHRLAAGEMIAVDDDRIQRGSSATWLVANKLDFGDHISRIGLASALIARSKVADALVNDILAFDKYADVRRAVEALEKEARIDVEVRQVVTTVTGTVEAVQNQGGAPPAGAPGRPNQVPGVSPASISVGGLTAIQLNQNAGILATRTNSLGLGTNGLSRLALPGSAGGVPTAGPSGVGGVRP